MALSNRLLLVYGRFLIQHWRRFAVYLTFRARNLGIGPFGPGTLLPEADAGF